MSPRPDWQIATDSRDRLGESPLWSSATGELYWIDFYGPTVRRLSEDGCRNEWRLSQFSSIGSLVLCEDARVLIATDNGVYFFDPQSGAVEFFADPNRGRVDLPYNDAKVDRRGNYWVGNFDATESEPRGILYVLNRHGEWSIGDSGFVVCNGPTFSPEGDVLYFSDSNARRTLAYDVDGTGRLTRRRVFHVFGEEDGLPDGCCVDRSGCLWIAMYGGSKVVRLSPSGERLADIRLPTPYITSCCLGGENLRTLFVTSARSTEGSDALGGALFRLDVPVPGLREPLFRFS